MLQIAPGWSMDVERGPDWLIVRLHCEPDHRWDSPPLAETVWSLLEQSLTHRLVLECHEVWLLHTILIGQLVILHKRILGNGGMMRLCGLSDQNQRVLHGCRLDDHFPQYQDRGEAVLGHVPNKPR